MFSLSYFTVLSPAIRRSVAITALTSACMLATPLTQAFAQSDAHPPVNPAPATPAPAHQPPSHPAQAARRAETIDQRITTLHAELKITPAEEPAWQAVAQTMHDNVAALQKITAEKSARQSMTAVEDLQTYKQFAQAHVDGLNKLIETFQTLYNAMPEPQQKLADRVFQRSRG